MGTSSGLCNGLTPMRARSWEKKKIQGNLQGIIDKSPEIAARLSPQSWEQSHRELPCLTQTKRTLPRLASSGPMHVCGAPDKFRAFLFTHLEKSSLQSYLCVSRVAWNEPKRSFITRQKLQAYRSQNNPLLCHPSPRKAAGLEAKGQCRDKASLCRAVTCSTSAAVPCSQGFLCSGQGERS